MKHRIDSLKDHYIVCGFGRVGEQIARELDAEGEPFVIIERDEDKLALAKDRNWAYLHGDVALDETVFQKARLQEAKAVIIAVGADADAIFIAISARAMKPEIFVVARASSREAADKLNKIGVNRVALPYQIGGYHMATMALRPTVVDFLNLLVDHEKEELEMEEFFVRDDGFYEGKSIQEAGLLKNNVAVLAIRRKNGKAVINPSDSTKLSGGDRLVLMGSEDDLAEIEKTFQKHQPKQNKDEREQTEPKVLIADSKPSAFPKE